MVRVLGIAGMLVFALAGSVGSAQASTGPVGQWRLDEGVGAVVADSSGYGDNGTVLGGAAWVSSPTGGALDFNGSTGRIEIPNAPQLEPSTGLTVSAWIERGGSPGTYRYVVSKGATGCTSASYGLYSGAAGGLQFYVSRNHGTVYARSPDAGPAVWDGSWHLVVGTFDGTTIRLYVDGRQIGSGTADPGGIGYALPDSNNLYIGAYPGTSNAPGCQTKNFLGDIADVEIWDRTLSAAEVSAMAQPSQQPPLPTGRVSISQINTGGATGSTPGGGAGTSGGGAGTSYAGGSAGTSLPVLRALKFSKLRRSLETSRGLSITYTDSQSANVTFTILRLSPKSRCVNSKPRRHTKRPTRCPRYVVMAKFTHRDHPGRNTLRLPSRIRLMPGGYLLEATPKARGRLGRTLSITFRIVR